MRANHKGLHECLEDTFALERAEGFAGYADYADTVEKDHGRIEIRRCRTPGDPDLLAHVAPDREWRDLTSLVWVESERRCGGRVSTEVRCFIPILPPQGPTAVGAVRKHWSIENAHHRVLDTAFGEDGSRIRTGHATHNMAILKKNRPQPAAAGPIPRVGIANKWLAAAWNKGLPVPTDWPQA